MTTQHLQPLLSGFFWGLSSSLLLIVAAVIASHDTLRWTMSTALADIDPVVTVEQHDLVDQPH